MGHILAEAGKSFLRAFGASLVVFLPGIAQAPSLHQALALAVAASIASVIAGIKVVQVLAPQLTVSNYLGKWPFLAKYGAILDSTLRAFVGSFLALLIGVLSAPDFNSAKALAIAGFIALFAGVFRTIQGFLTPGEHPAPQAGLVVPPK